MITRRQLILILSVAVLLVVVAIGSLIYRSMQKEASFDLKEEDTDQTSRIVDVDYKGNTDLLTSAQKRQLSDTLINKTMSKIPKNTQLKAVLRDGSITEAGGETLFILDMEQLKTSYTISRYVSTEDQVDIVNVICAPADKRIYEPDGCRED